METVSTYDSSQLTEQFNSVLEESLQEVIKAETFEAYETALADGATTLAAAIANVGSTSADFLENSGLPANDSNSLGANVVSYLWLEEAKGYLLLWRDILLQEQKAVLMELDGKVSKGNLSKLQVASKDILRNASEDLKVFYDQSLANFKRGDKKSLQQIKKWQFQQNPWSMYQAQFEQIAKQCKNAEIQQNGLQNTAKGFHEIKQLLKETISSCEHELDQLRVLSTDTKQFIEEHIETKPGKVALHLEELENKISIPGHFTIFSQDLDMNIANLAAKMQVPIDTNGGMVQYKEANFKKNARQWLDSEIVPVLYEIWELTEGAEHNMKMSLVNVRNRAVLLSNELKEGTSSINFEKESYCQPLEAMIKKVDSWMTSIKELEQLIEKRLEDSFNLSSIYNTEKTFLPVSLQSTLSQYSLGENKFLKKARTQLSRPGSVLKRFRDKVSEQENLSDSEKIVRTIEDRNVRTDNNQYTSIFQTKGYIGESFWVGREQELQRIHNLIDQWELGYRGTVLLSGSRLSGKSLFGDVVANKYFPRKTIRLAPNTHLNTEGRKWTTTTDLKEALDFVKKIALKSRTLVWIDDLELWQDPTISLGQNIRYLQEHMDQHGTQLFYIVSMSKWLEEHLQKTHLLKDSFQALIRLDNMSVAEIQQAILIRHGATHKILVDAEGVEVEPEAFTKMSAAVCTAAKGNIGDALNRWAASIRKVEEEQVTHDRVTTYPLPSFLSTNGSLLLATIFKEKRTNEYRLRRLFGVSFKEKYSHVLQRFISIGILKRQIDGMLEINENIANDLGEVLMRNKYL